MSLRWALIRGLHLGYSPQALPTPDFQQRDIANNTSKIYSSSRKLKLESQINHCPQRDSMGAKIQPCCGATQRNVLSKVGLNKPSVACGSIKCTIISAKSKWRPPRWWRLMHEQLYLPSSLVVATHCSWDSQLQSYYSLPFRFSDLFHHAAQTHTQSPINQDARQTSEWKKEERCIESFNRNANVQRKINVCGHGGRMRRSLQNMPATISSSLRRWSLLCLPKRNISVEKPADEKR